jgi:hypothetical protein
MSANSESISIQIDADLKQYQNISIHLNHIIKSVHQ